MTAHNAKKIDWDAVRDLVAIGEPNYLIAEAIGCTTQTLRRHARLASVPLRPSREPITAEQLRRIASYDGATGVMTWTRTRFGAEAGERVGTRNPQGYLDCSIFGRFYKVHNLIWLYVHGSWPDVLVDHRNGDPSDDRLDNLRAATHAGNSRNQRLRRDNTSGFKGVSRKGKRWQAGIVCDGKRHNLGSFPDPVSAHQAYVAAAAALHGEFFRESSATRRSS